MKAYHCDGCGSLVFFDNVSCLTCHHALGFLPASGELRALEPAGEGVWRPVASGTNGPLHRKCANAEQHQVCNWMTPVDDPNPFCVSCRLNEVIPNLEAPGNLERWRRLEMAKRRIVYTILQLGLPMDAVAAEKRPALRFKFLGEAPGQPPVLTGHAQGLITVNIAEADDDERERRRVNLHEPYRTLLGHLRHEVAHYYWDRLIANSAWLERWRAVFGDENKNYAEALKTHYEQGPPADWPSHFVSAYAASHPWEDWAETWAHYFHIIDTLETAASFGMSLKPRHPAAPTMTSDPRLAAKSDASFDLLLEQWFPIVYALNALNRGMGLHDLYPFALSSPAIAKLRFAHEVAQTARRGGFVTA
ncbi:MAG TPA: putative zinc-binding peptidase [Verrucomicrobiae bacterium]|jgi:hypothetical protein|nr:putative zinc-binding peptidase [Verrucomicrobiae bacterium]